MEGRLLIVLILVILLSITLRLCLLLLIRFSPKNCWIYLIQSFQSLTTNYFVLFLRKLRFMNRLSVWARRKLRVLMALQRFSMLNIGTASKARFCWLLVIFFYSNQLLQEQNHTFIALIPKRLGAFAVQHFWPISLCNIIYKIISKLLANRLKPLLSKIISTFQSAFVPGRHIQDNSILSHEMLHSFKNKQGRGGFMAVNIDMEKTFDKMEWAFLLIIMKKLGFHPKWINWIRICLSTSSFSVLLNVSLFGLFRPFRGYAKVTLFRLFFLFWVQKLF
jgi:hypothetical protein